MAERVDTDHCAGDGGSSRRARRQPGPAAGVATATGHVALVGSPNAGKTTLFNALSGLRAKTANYPGVTVSRREADVDLGGHVVTLVDLPGTYSLEPISPDEQIVVDALHGRVPGIDAPDALVVVADATTLERSLLLLAEVLQLGLPTCLVVTMIDEVVARGGSIDVDRLGVALGLPVVGVVGHRGVGVETVRQLLTDTGSWDRPALTPPGSGLARSAWVDSLLRSAITPLQPDRRTRRADAVLLHPVWGTVVFVVVMLAFFQSIFVFAAPAMDAIGTFFDWLGQSVVDALPGVFGQLIGEGIIAGVGSVLVFLPQILLLFLIVALLEKVGYMARAAFLADRVMGRFGLEGRSFVSMLSSFACAIPGIMSTRTIPSDRRRMATMMAAPLMTCSARLPVYTLLIAAFVPDEPVVGPLRAQGLVLFGLYVLGAVSGLVYAALFSARRGAGAAVPFTMELPPYRLPTVRAVLRAMWDAAWAFLRKAGTIILAASIVLWMLLHLPVVEPPPGLSEAEATSYQMENSIAGRIGTGLEPVFAPLGFNWQINVALLGSLAAREVFVSTLALTTASDSEDALPERLQTLERPDGTPLFDAPTVAALLVFFVYALQCLSTVAVLRRETNSWRWPLFAMGSMFVLAYTAALVAHTITAAVT